MSEPPQSLSQVLKRVFALYNTSWFQDSIRDFKEPEGFVSENANRCGAIKSGTNYYYYYSTVLYVSGVIIADSVALYQDYFLERTDDCVKRPNQCNNTSASTLTSNSKPASIFTAKLFLNNITESTTLSPDNHHGYKY